VIALNLEKTTRWLAIAIGIAFIALVLTLSIIRLAYPYEIEWMEGAMMDHVVRILSGKPIYTAPSIDFVAWLYPPLYYYAVAAVAKVTGIGFLSGRIVSLASTIFTALALGHITRVITKNLTLGLLTTALYFATYHTTGFYFDIVRNDAFFTMVIVAAALAAVALPKRFGVVASALILCAAFLTRQQAIFFLPPITLWYWLRERKDGVAFGMIAVGLSIAANLILNHLTDGWSNYYMFRIPSAKQADFMIIRMFDVFPNFALGAFSISFIAGIVLILLKCSGAISVSDCLEKSRSKIHTFFASDAGLIVMMMFSALAAGAMSLGNEGGYRNVMMPFVAFVIPALPIALVELQKLRPVFSRYIYLPVLFQFAALYFNPFSQKMLIASPHQQRGGDEFMRNLAAMTGEVFIPYHGYITLQAGKQSHAHILAAIDVLRMHDTTARGLQSEFDSAYSQQRFSAIILEESDTFQTDTTLNHYTFSRRMIAEPNVYLTRVADGVTRPEFVFVPSSPGGRK